VPSILAIEFSQPDPALYIQVPTLNTSDFWKLNDLIDALYVIVDCHLRQDKAKRLIADIETWLRAQN
jgi:hypothetical protein